MRLKKELSLIDAETGEILEEKILLDLLEEDRKNFYIGIFHKYKNNPYSLTVQEIELLVKVINSKNKAFEIQLEKYEVFDNRVTVNIQAFSDTIESLSAGALKSFAKLLRYTSSSYTLQKDNHRNIVSDKDFYTLLEISERAWRDIKIELINKRAIRKIKFNGTNLYKINPTIVGLGMTITPDVYFAFRDVFVEVFKSQLKIIYWDKKILDAYGSKLFINSVNKSFVNDYFDLDTIKQLKNPKSD